MERSKAHAPSDKLQQLFHIRKAANAGASSLCTLVCRSTMESSMCVVIRKRERRWSRHDRATADDGHGAVCAHLLR